MEFFIIWYGLGILGIAIYEYNYWKLGYNLTLKDLFLDLIWAGVGPFVIIYLLNIKDIVLIKGRKKDESK